MKSDSTFTMSQMDATMNHIDRRDFAKFVLASLTLPTLLTSELGNEDSPIISKADNLVIPPPGFKYSSEITHNDIHELEFASERVFDRIKSYHSGERLVLANFKAAYQASYDFHSHMHSPFEEDHARTREAFDRLIPVFERLDDSTRKSETRHYFDELHGWYMSLRSGIVPG